MGWLQIKRLLSDFRFLRFLIVGGVNTAFNYLIYVFLLFIGFNYLIATTIALVIGIMFNFKTHGKFVFNNQNNNLFYRYVISWFLIYLVNLGVLSWLVKNGIDRYYAGGILILPIAILSFFLMKFIVFKEGNSTT